MEGGLRAIVGDQVSGVTNWEVLLLTKVLEIRKAEVGLQTQGDFLFLESLRTTSLL